MAFSDHPAIVAIHHPSFYWGKTQTESSLLWLIDFAKMRRSFGLVNRYEHRPWQTLIRKQWLLTLIRQLGGGYWSEAILHSQKSHYGYSITSCVDTDLILKSVKGQRKEAVSFCFRQMEICLDRREIVKKSNWRQREPLKERQWMGLTDWIIKKVRLPARCVSLHTCRQAHTHTHTVLREAQCTGAKT